MGMKKHAKLEAMITTLRDRGVIHYQGPIDGEDGPPVILTLDPNFAKQHDEDDIEPKLTPEQEQELRRKSPDGLLDSERKEQYYSAGS